MIKLWQSKILVFSVMWPVARPSKEDFSSLQTRRHRFGWLGPAVVSIGDPRSRELPSRVLQESKGHVSIANSPVLG